MMAARPREEGAGGKINASTSVSPLSSPLSYQWVNGSMEFRVPTSDPIIAHKPCL